MGGQRNHDEGVEKETNTSQGQEDGMSDINITVVLYKEHKRWQKDQASKIGEDGLTIQYKES